MCPLEYLSHLTPIVPRFMTHNILTTSCFVNPTISHVNHFQFFLKTTSKIFLFHPKRKILKQKKILWKFIPLNSFSWEKKFKSLLLSIEIMQIIPRNLPSIHKTLIPFSQFLLIGIISSIIVYCIMLHSSSKIHIFFHKTLMIDRSVCICIDIIFEMILTRRLFPFYTQNIHMTHMFLRRCTAVQHWFLWKCICGR